MNALAATMILLAATTISAHLKHRININRSIKSENKQLINHMQNVKNLVLYDLSDIMEHIIVTIIMYAKIVHIQCHYHVFISVMW